MANRACSFAPLRGLTHHLIPRLRRGLAIGAVEKLVRWEAKGFKETQERREPNLSDTALDTGDLDRRQPSLIGQLFLSPPLCCSRRS